MTERASQSQWQNSQERDLQKKAGDALVALIHVLNLREAKTIAVSTPEGLLTVQLRRDIKPTEAQPLGVVRFDPDA
jgi:hypothetical protein